MSWILECSGSEAVPIIFLLVKDKQTWCSEVIFTHTQKKKKKRRERFYSKMECPFWEGWNVLCENLSELYIFFFFCLPTSSCNIHPNRLEWTSHSGQNSFASVSCSIDVSSFHTQDFCSHSAFTNLRYRRIQEHVVILLSNNCAVFVVHFWPVFDITSMPWQEDLI